MQGEARLSEFEPSPREQRILLAAQLIVDEWHLLCRQGSFVTALIAAERHQIPYLNLTDLEHRAFFQVANAIRVGRGHARTDPRPLVSLMRLEQERLATLPPGGSFPWTEDCGQGTAKTLFQEPTSRANKPRPGKFNDGLYR